MEFEMPCYDRHNYLVVWANFNFILQYSMQHIDSKYHLIYYFLPIVSWHDKISNVLQWTPKLLLILYIIFIDADIHILTIII